MVYTFDVTGLWENDNPLIEKTYNITLSLSDSKKICLDQESTLNILLGKSTIKDAIQEKDLTEYTEDTTSSLLGQIFPISPIGQYTTNNYNLADTSIDFDITTLSDKLLKILDNDNILLGRILSLNRNVSLAIIYLLLVGNWVYDDIISLFQNDEADIYFKLVSELQKITIIQEEVNELNATVNIDLDLSVYSKYANLLKQYYSLQPESLLDNNVASDFADSIYIDISDEIENQINQKVITDKDVLNLSITLKPSIINVLWNGSNSDKDNIYKNFIEAYIDSEIAIMDNALGYITQAELNSQNAKYFKAQNAWKEIANKGLDPKAEQYLKTYKEYISNINLIDLNIYIKYLKNTEPYNILCDIKYNETENNISFKIKNVQNERFNIDLTDTIFNFAAKNPKLAYGIDYESINKEVYLQKFNEWLSSGRIDQTGYSSLYNALTNKSKITIEISVPSDAIIYPRYQEKTFDFSQKFDMQYIDTYILNSNLYNSFEIKDKINLEE